MQNLPNIIRGETGDGKKRKRFIRNGKRERERFSEKDLESRKINKKREFVTL